MLSTALSAVALSGVVLIGLSNPALAQQTGWQGDGATPTDYFDADNWDNGVPTATGHADFSDAVSTDVVVNADTTTDDWHFYNTTTDYTVSGTGTVTLNGAVNEFGGNYLGLTHDSNNTVTISLDMDGGAPINQVGPGTLNLSGTIALSGGTTVSDGTLAVTGSLTSTSATTLSGDGIFNLTGAGTTASTAITASGTSQLNTDGGALSSSVAVTLNDTSSMNLTGTETIGSLAGGSGAEVTLTGAGTVLTTGGDNTSTEFAGVISGDGGLTKEGTGTFTLSGANTYAGVTNLDGGTLELANNAALGATGPLATAGTYADNGTTLDYANGVSIAESIDVTGAVSLNQTGGTATQSGVISGSGGINKTGTGILELSGANTYAGVTNLDAGTLRLANNAALGATGALATAGTYADTGTTLDYANGVSIAESIDVTGTVSFNQTGGTATQSGVVSGSGGLTKTGTGTLALSATNTYTGATTVNGGTLNITGSVASSVVTGNNAGVIQVDGASLSDTAAVTLNDTSNLTLTDSETIGSLAGATGATVTLGANTLTTGGNNSSTTFAGAIGGTGGVTKEGTGTFTLTGTSTYTGVTTVNAGTLNLQAANASGTDAGGVVVASGAALELQTATAGIDYGAEALTIGGSGIAGAGALRNVDGSNEWGGAVTLTSTTTINVVADQLELSGAIGGGANGITKTGTGTLLISNGANTYTGLTTVSAGTLNLTGNIAGSVDNDATFNNNGGTVTGGLDNSLTASNSGTINGGLTNSGTYTQTAGSTNGGTTNTGTVNANGGAFNGGIDNDDQFNVAGTVTSDGDFDNSTDATLAVNSGAFTVGLDLTNDGGIVTIAAGATLNVTGDFFNQNGGEVTNNGTVNDDLTNGVGSTVTNNNIWNADVASNLGTIVNNATWVGDVNNNGGTWVATNGATSVTGNFANGGLIDMQDADTQDTMTITGNLTGTGEVNYDIDLADGGVGGPQLSDLLVVTGDYTADSTFNFRNLGNGQRLQPDILVADIQGTNTGTAIATGLPTAGLVEYQLENIGGDYYVTSSANLEAVGGIASNIAVVQATIGAIVNRPSSPFVTGLAADVEPNHCGAGPWMRATGGVVNATGTTTSPASAATDANVDLRYAGGQFGLDLACFNVKESGIDVAVGAIAGFNGGTSSQDVTGLGTTESSFQQGFGGLYATVAKGAFAADIQARVDYTDYNFDNPLISLDDASLDTLRYTLSGSASYAIPVKEFSLVPTVGFSASTTSAGTLDFTTGQTLSPDDSISLVGFAGATVAKTIVLPDQVSAVTPFVTGTVYNDFAEYPTAVFFDPLTGESQTITSTHLGMIGEASLGLNYVKIMEGDGPKQINATVRADARFSDRVLGGGITGQVRAQF